MNVELLQKIKRKILRYPEKLRMDEWNCGTAQCIGGHAISLSGIKWVKTHAGYEPVTNQYSRAHDFWGSAIQTIARKVLKLTDNQAGRLFHDSSWPDSFYERFHKARTRKERAKIAAERIDRFIATKGRE